MKSFAETEIDRMNTTLHTVEHRIKRDVDRLKQDAGVELDAKICAYQETHKDVSYSEAMAIVMQEHPALAAEYAASFGHNEKVSPRQAREFGLNDETDISASDEVDRLAMNLQREHPGWSYETCLGQVLQENPELKKRYAANR